MNVIWLGIIALAIAIAGMWWSIFSIAAVIIAILGRGWISYRHRVRENSATYYFTPQKKGAYGISHYSFFTSREIRAANGRDYYKCNGQITLNKDEFYKALQKNRAYCKLEVFDVNGEIRFVQGALFEGDQS